MSQHELDTTIDEWRKAMENLSLGGSRWSSLPSLPKGKTTNELCEIFGVCEEVMRRRVRKLIKEGRCKKGKAPREMITGEKRIVPVYQLIYEKEQQ